jgi:molybdopterin synthase catalytic subunit
MPISLLAKKEDSIDICSLIQQVKSSLKGNACGAIATFTGIVRAKGADGAAVDHLEYEVYEDAARKSLDAMVKAVVLIEGVHEAAICHKYGKFIPGEEVLYVVIAAERSQVAFDILRLAVAKVKHELPIWKKEATAGGKHWVDVD